MDTMNERHITGFHICASGHWASGIVYREPDYLDEMRDPTITLPAPPVLQSEPCGCRLESVALKRGTNQIMKVAYPVTRRTGAQRTAAERMHDAAFPPPPIGRHPGAEYADVDPKFQPGGRFGPVPAPTRPDPGVPEKRTRPRTYREYRGDTWRLPRMSSGLKWSLAIYGLALLAIVLIVLSWVLG